MRPVSHEKPPHTVLVMVVLSSHAQRVELMWFLRLLARETERLHRLHFLVSLLGPEAWNYTILRPVPCEKASHAFLSSYGC